MQVDTDLDFSSLLRTEGWINKKGGAVNASTFGRKNWKRRWFVLKYSPQRGKPNYQLVYYDSPGGTVKGTVDLQGTEVYCEKGKNVKRAKHEFQILLNTGNTLHLSCDNLQERDEWIETLNIVLFRLKKVNAVVPGLDELLKGYDPSLEDEEGAYAAGDEIAQMIQAFGPGLFGAEVGQHAQFVLQMYDKEGTSVSVGGLNFTASLLDDECLYHIRVVDNDNGTYSAHYVISRPGIYQLNIRLNDEHEIFGSPFRVEVLPSRTVPEKCTCEGDCLTTGFPVNKTSSFTLIARDQFGNKKKTGGDVFELGVMGPALLSGLVDKGDGTYICSVDTQNPLDSNQITSASLLITVTLYGKHVSGSPFRPQIIPGQSDILQTATIGPRNVPSKRTPSTNNVMSPPSSVRQSFNASFVSPGESSPIVPRNINPESNIRDNSQTHRRTDTSKSSSNPSGGNSVSRLEAARQRAMNGIINTSSAHTSQEMTSDEFYRPKGDDNRTGSIPPKSKQNNPTSATDLASRLNKLEMMTRQVGQGGTASAAISSVRRSNSGSSKGTDNNLPPPPPPDISPPSNSKRIGQTKSPIISGTGYNIDPTVS
jgi:hypothetical protein